MTAKQSEKSLGVELKTDVTRVKYRECLVHGKTLSGGKLVQGCNILFFSPLAPFRHFSSLTLGRINFDLTWLSEDDFILLRMMQRGSSLFSPFFLPPQHMDFICAFFSPIEHFAFVLKCYF